MISPYRNPEQPEKEPPPPWWLDSPPTPAERDFWVQAFLAFVAHPLPTITTRGSRQGKGLAAGTGEAFRYNASDRGFASKALTRLG